MRVFWAFLLVMNLFSTAKSDTLYTVDDRIRQYGAVVETRLQPVFQAAQVPYPPASLVLIGLKQERMLQVYATGPDGKFHFVRQYSVLAASGVAGPKKREGDQQVPEGIYKIDLLNPNSKFHLSMRVNYPNEFDRAMAAKEGRTTLGGDIMIHGNRVSIGCLAMGDEAAEDLFVLAALTGIQNIQVILCPVDFRTGAKPDMAADAPDWLPGLYEKLKAELEKYPTPQP